MREGNSGMVGIGYLLRFIEEDAPFGDITSEAIIPHQNCRAVIRAEEGGIAAGISEVHALFSHFGVSAAEEKHDGDPVFPQDILVSLAGDAGKILLVERTALNLIGRMSGIATQTRRLSDLVREVNPRCRIAATRKTCPGMRALDKKAVRIGGGDPHRMSLSDGILIKDNHLMIIPLAEAIRKARSVSRYCKVETEVETPGDALLAAREGTDIILLDNMDPAKVQETITLLGGAGLREKVILEVSGGISQKDLPCYASLDIDVISMGALTHTVRNFPVTLEILPEPD